MKRLAVGGIILLVVYLLGGNPQTADQMVHPSHVDALAGAAQVPNKFRRNAPKRSEDPAVVGHSATGSGAGSTIADPVRQGRPSSFPAIDGQAQNQARSKEEFFRWQKLLGNHQETKRTGTANIHSAQTTAAGGILLVCEPNHAGAALIHRAVPFGFVFDPADYAEGRIEMRNLQDKPLIMSVNGTEGILINGQPARPGAAYPIDGSLEVSAPSPVRIHVRPGTAMNPSIQGAG